jgi:HEPN domain-containing protein
MKAVLVAAGLDPPKTHDLDELADLAAAAWPSLVDHLDACRPLTPWNVEYRYPPGVHAAPLPTAAEVQSALDRLRAFRRAAGVIAGETS